MTIQNSTTLKSYFETGDKPTEAEFIDFIDTVFDMANRLGLKNIDSGDIGDGKVLTYDITSDTIKYRSPSGLIGTKEVDESNIGDQRILVYDSVSNKVKYTLISEESGKIGSKNVNEAGIVDGSILIYDNTNSEWIMGTFPNPMTDAEVKIAYENNPDTNAYTDFEKSKLSNIEPNATSDQTAGEIKTAYESNANTNAYTDTEKSKLTGIESNATADQTAGEIKTAYESNANTNAYTDAEKAKLSTLESLYDHVVDTIAEKDALIGLTAGETIFVRENGQVYVVGVDGLGSTAINKTIETVLNTEELVKAGSLY